MRLGGRFEGAGVRKGGRYIKNLGDLIAKNRFCVESFGECRSLIRFFESTPLSPPYAPRKVLPSNIPFYIVVFHKNSFCAILDFFFDLDFIYFLKNKITISSRQKYQLFGGLKIDFIEFANLKCMNTILSHFELMSRNFKCSLLK